MNCDVFKSFVKILSMWKDSKNKTKVITFVRIMVEHKNIVYWQKLQTLMQHARFQKKSNGCWGI